MVINVCLAGATGWAGSELARSMAKTEGVAPVATVSRTHAGRSLGDVLLQKLVGVHRGLDWVLGL